MKPRDDFRGMVQAEANRRLFSTKRAFVADGASGFGTLRDRHFPDFVPIHDFVHVAEYLQAAAHDLQRAWTYLTNHSDKLDDPRYRRIGLPTTSSLMESQVKEFNARVKGAKKF